MFGALEALHFVGMVTLEPHLAGKMVTENVGTEWEPVIVAGLKEYEAMLRDYHCKKVVTDIITAFEAR